jgi:hypothetical protein
LPFGIFKGQSEAVNQRKDRYFNDKKIPKGNQKTEIKGRTDNIMTKRYQRAIRSCKSKERQTTQWPKDTKGQSEAVNQRKDRQHNGKKIPKGNQKL